MSKKQLLAVGLIALSLVSSGVIYQRIQNETSDVDLAEEGFIEGNVSSQPFIEGNIAVSQVTNVQDIVTQIEAMKPQDQTVINALSAIKNLYAQKSQVIGQIGALDSQFNSLDLEINAYMKVLQVWREGQAVQ